MGAGALQVLDQQLVFEAMMVETARAHAERSLVRRGVRGWKREAAAAAEERERCTRRTAMWGKINAWLHELKDSTPAGDLDLDGLADLEARTGVTAEPAEGLPGRRTAGREAAVATGPQRRPRDADRGEAKSTWRTEVGSDLECMDKRLTDELAAELDAALNAEEIPQLRIRGLLEEVRRGTDGEQRGDPGVAACVRGRSGDGATGVSSKAGADREAAEASLQGSGRGDIVDVDGAGGAAASADSDDGTWSRGAASLRRARRGVKGAGAADRAGRKANGSRGTIREKLAGFVQRRGEKAGADGRGSDARAQAAAKPGAGKAIKKGGIVGGRGGDRSAASAKSVSSGDGKPLRAPEQGDRQSMVRSRIGRAAAALPSASACGVPRVGASRGQGSATGASVQGGLQVLRAGGGPEKGRGAAAGGKPPGSDAGDAAVGGSSGSDSGTGASQGGAKPQAPLRCCKAGATRYVVRRPAVSDSEDDTWASPPAAGATPPAAGVAGAGDGEGRVERGSHSGGEDEDEDDEFAWIMFRALPRQRS